MRYKDNEFLNIINDLICNENVKKLENFTHHYGYNRLEHSIDVAYYSYKICKFLNLDYVSVARASILHDLFFYDCQDKLVCPKFHIWKHPKTALLNAEKLFILNDLEKDIILKHMWPITFFPPRYLESLLVSGVDKYCALTEWIHYCTFKNRYQMARAKREPVPNGTILIKKAKKEPAPNGRNFFIQQFLLKLAFLALVILLLRLQLLLKHFDISSYLYLLV